MKYCGAMLLLAGLLVGCKTHQKLLHQSALVAGTLTDLNYQQVLDNVALFHANPDALPAIGVVNAGTVTVQDQGSATTSAQYSPTLHFAQQGGGGFILMLLPGFGIQRQVGANWSLVPVTDSDNLRRLRCAFQYLVRGDEPAQCENCRQRLQRFFLGEGEDFDCLVPRGWYFVGCRKDVPKDACYVGCHGDTCIWVMPEGRDGLTRFTITVLDLATGKLHAPQRTVVKTYKADGTLDSTQVTTTEIDQEALQRLQKNQGHLPERERPNVDAPAHNRGLHFVPR